MFTDCSVEPNGNSYEQILDKIKAGEIDGQSDLYYFNFAGYSGKFVIGNDGQTYIIPQQKVKIVPPTDDVSEWIITTPDGMRYEFGSEGYTETSSSYTTTFVQTEEVGSSNSFNSYANEVSTSWYLKRMVSPTGSEIKISYITPNTDVKYAETYSFERYDLAQQIPIKNPCDDFSCFPYTVINKTTASGRLIYPETISFTNGYCRFNYSDQRCDLPGAKRLESMEVYNATNELIKEYKLRYSYKNLSDYQSQDIDEGLGDCNSINANRLWLVKVEEVGNAGKTYDLNYNAGELPAQGSFSQDFWGFANGNKPPIAEGDPIKYEDFIPAYQTNGRRLAGANRQADEDKLTYGLLNKITYPTGSYTAFTYEPHDWYAGQREEFAYEDVLEMRVCYDPPNFCAGAPITDEQSFTVAKGEKIYLNYQLFGTGRFELNGPGDIFYRYNNGVQPADERGTMPSYVETPGSYTISMEADTQEPENEIIFSARKQVSKGFVSFNETGGGIRIKQIANHDGLNSANDMIKEYIYKESEDANNSSGVSFLSADFISTGEQARFCTISSGSSPVPIPSVLTYTCQYLRRSSYTQVPLETTGQGSHVGYSKVLEISLNNNGQRNGMTSYTFTNNRTSINAPENPTLLYPTAPQLSYSYKNGLLRKQEVFGYDNVEKQYFPVKTTENFYTNTNLKQIWGVIPYSGGSPSNQTPNVNARCESEFGINTIFFNTSTEWIYLNRSITTTYDQANKDRTITITNIFKHDNIDHLQRTQATIVNSENQTLTTNYQYAADFTNNTYGSNLLRENHMHSQVLEQTTTVASTTTQKITTQYEQVAAHVVPKIITNYPTGDNTTNSEAQQTEYEYDDYGNITQVLGTDGVPTAYVWGYNYTLPVAQVVGAFYETEVKTKLNLSALQSMDGKELQTALNNLRSLNDAQVTTYTHDPLVGITSATDPAGRISTYHYDDLNRLQWIESEEGHVVQKFDYQYAQ